jgi:sec-independent protein translocase protein TatA
MSLGIVELAVLAAVVVLLFGTGRLARAMGDLAQGARAFREGMKDVEPPPEPVARAAGGPALTAPPPRRDQPARP